MNSLSDELARAAGISNLSRSDRQRLFDTFDHEFYLDQNPDLHDEDPFVHYMTEGWRECRDPSSGFHTLDYILKHREVLRTGTHPFVSFVLGGHALSLGLELADPPSPASGWTPPRSWERPPRGDIDPSAIPAASDPPTGCKDLDAKDIQRLRDAFDSIYYLDHNPEVASSGVDPFQHYMSVGWRERRDPNATFSTGFYLVNYPDIDASGMNPFIHWVLHGIGENRVSMSFKQRLDLKSHAPTVSAIIPNYNHGKYLSERIESILDQTYPNITITILDDCSSDNSREVIDSYVGRYPDRIRAIYNSANSGGVFRQWRKGVLETEGDLLWICESDDFCEPDFVEKLVPHFRDESVQIAFGRILETDVEGKPNLGLDDYREIAEPGIWAAPLVRPAAAWFANAFGVRNVIANVGGCIWRRAPIADAVWQEAGTYSVVGDWYLYIQVAGGGQIAWEPQAVSYFRRHGSNTSSTSFVKPKFYHELERLMVSLRKTWHVPEATVRRFHQKIVEQYEWFNVKDEYGPLEDHCSLKKLLAVHRERPHVLLAMYGFIPGGGENFPIFLANGLVDSGWTVSMLVFETRESNAHMRQALNPAVSVYEASWVSEYGADRFIADAGISLIHSHTVGAELHFFHMWRAKQDVRFLVTLHGSYEASELPHDVMRSLVSPIDHFVYTADKNLLPLKPFGVRREQLTKMPNAMPVDPEPFPKTRAELGIAEDAVVFTLVARGIERKGWRAAIEAFRLIRNRHRAQPMHLCLVGEGDVPDKLKKKHGRDPDISFLGYQSRINGLYRMTDVAIVPTRFSGESYPLCIIQALQVGTPVIGSDVGEIRRMLTPDGGSAGGLVIDAVRDTNVFTTKLADAMERMLDPALRNQLAEGAQELGHDYDMGRLVETYGEIYKDLLTRGGRQSSPEIARNDNMLPNMKVSRG